MGRFAADVALADTRSANAFDGSDGTAGLRERLFDPKAANVRVIADTGTHPDRITDKVDGAEKLKEKERKPYKFLHFIPVFRAEFFMTCNISDIMFYFHLQQQT